MTDLLEKRYPAIPVSFLMREFMSNHFSMRSRRGLTMMHGHGLLDIAEELEVPVEKENTPSREKLLKRARQNPFKTAWVIRNWLREDERSRKK